MLPELVSTPPSLYITIQSSGAELESSALNNLGLRQNVLALSVAQNDRIIGE
jgi:hypothetical protein